MKSSGLQWSGLNWSGLDWGQIGHLAWQHVWLSAVPIAAGIVLSIPFGWLATRRRATRSTLLGLSQALYAVPSLPLLVVLPSLLGTQILDPVNVEVALTVYAVALMLRTAADAFAGVAADVKLSATAVGFGRLQRFWRVELPLAGPATLAGARVVAVSTVSLVTVGSLVGVDSLGTLFVDGYQRDYVLEVWVALIGTVAIAVAFDRALVLVGRWTMPWLRAQGRR